MNRMAKGMMGAAVLLLAQGAVAQLSNGLYAAFDTSMGSFTARLDYAEAPVTCANFAGLAEGSQHWIDPETGSVRSDPFYDGLIFHRVITNFMIQGGCPLGNGTGGPGYAIPDEFSTNLTHHSAGILSMANSGPDSGGSQFFITLKNTDWLDNKHAVFGEVVDGMDVVYSIGAVETDGSDRPLVDVEINHIQVLRVGDDAQNFDPLAQPIPKVTPLSVALSVEASGMEVSAVASNQCEQKIYRSIDLSSWSPVATQYWSAAEGSWSVPVATNSPSAFFKGTRVYCPQAVPGLVLDVTGHHLEFERVDDSALITFDLEEGGGGTCNIIGNPDTITSWAWHPSTYLFYFQVSTAGGYTLLFQVYYGGPANWAWEGFYYSAGQWNYMGNWAFTDTPPAE